MSEGETMSANTTTEEHPATLYPVLELFFGVLICCVMVVAIVGNTLTFLVVTRMKSWKSSAIMFIAHLGVVDIINSCFITPFSATVFFAGRLDTLKFYGTEDALGVYQVLCGITSFFFVFVRVLVPLTNLNIAVDRTIAVTLPLKYSAIMSPISVILLLAIDWLIAIGFASVSMIDARILGNDISFKYNEYTSICTPEFEDGFRYMVFVTVLTVTTVLIPFLFVFILSAIVIQMLLGREKQKNAAVNGGGGDTKSARRSNRTRKATHTLMIVVCMYMVFWLPYCIMWVLEAREADIDDTVQLYAVTVATICIYMNSAMNPLIFISRSEKYRSVICQSLESVRQALLSYKVDVTGSMVTVNEVTVNAAAQDSCFESTENGQSRQLNSTFL